MSYCLRTTRLAACALALSLALWQPGVAQDPAPPELQVHGLAALMARLHLQPSDFQFRDDYMPPDSFSLETFLRLNHRPLELTDLVRSWVERADAGDPAALLRLALDHTESEYGPPDARVAETPETLLRGVNLYYNDTDLNRLLSLLYELTTHMLPAASDSTLGRLSADERAFLHQKLPQQLLEDEMAHERDALAHDSLQQLERRQLTEFVAFGGKARPEFSVAAGVAGFVAVLSEIDALVTALKNKQITIEEFLTSDIETPERNQGVPYLGRHDGWLISGLGDDHHVGDYTVILDFGGNDRYDLTADPSRPHPVIIIDFAGDDIYNGGDFTLGAGALTTSYLFDLSGSDVYQGRNFSLGCGWFGVGVLFDREGDDRYLGDTFTQGAGGFGLGALIDLAGRDVYQGALFAQAVGFTKGIGILADYTGNDSYSAGNKYSDVLRYDNHYLSLSQGFGYGLRPFMSGGIGALIDLAGNDTYVADIFGQGCSYWRSIGFLADKSGNDHYIAYQYAQGSATHMTLGALIDFAGDDFYRSKGVSQGCGHDYSLGALVDESGDDVYFAVDLSQAAGSANGVGLLCDLAGADRYHISDPANTHGYGNPRREFGSLGLMLDLEGADRYDGHGADNSLWFGDGLWGGGLDCDWREWFPEWVRSDGESR